MRESGFKANIIRTLSMLKRSTPAVVFLVIILITVCVHFVTGNFYTQYNMSTLARQVSFIIIVGFAQTIVLLTGGIDLSVASVSGISSMIVATLLTTTGLNIYLSILISATVGLVSGFINGVFIAYIRVTPFIVTLATGEIYKGIVYVITRGMPIINVPEEATRIATGMIGGIIPNVAVIMIIICILLNTYIEENKVWTTYFCYWR